MIRRTFLLALVSVLLPVGLAWAQESYPIMEKVAQKVIEQYQTASVSSWRSRKNSLRRGKGADGAARHANPAQRSADADRVPQPGGGAHRQQTVRVRPDSLMVTGQRLRWRCSLEA